MAAGRGVPRRCRPARQRHARIPNAAQPRGLHAGGAVLPAPGQPRHAGELRPAADGHASWGRRDSDVAPHRRQRRPLLRGHAGRRARHGSL